MCNQSLKRKITIRGIVYPYYVMVFVFVLCTSCSSENIDPSWSQIAQNLMVSPLSPVKFISSLDPYPGSTVASASRLCAVVNQGIIFEDGDEASQLAHHISSHFEVYLDNRPIPVSGSTAILTEYGGKNGTWGGAMTICSTVEPSTGLHLAKVQTESTSGKVYAYTWAFRIDPTVSSDAATKAQETIDPFSSHAPYPKSSPSGK